MLEYGANIEGFPRVTFKELDKLPTVAGVYFALAGDGEVLYVGRASNIQFRWRNSHHRYAQLRDMGCTHIAWITVDDRREHSSLELYYILKLRPKLNGAEVPNKWVKARIDAEKDELVPIDALPLDASFWGQFRLLWEAEVRAGTVRLVQCPCGGIHPLGPGVVKVLAKKEE